jgi:hypothetical protein
MISRCSSVAKTGLMTEAQQARASPVLQQDFADGRCGAYLAGDRHDDHIGALALVGARADDDGRALLGLD